MKLTTQQLRKIIVEEYIKEENLVEADQEEIEKLLRQIQGDKYRPPEERYPERYRQNEPSDTAPMDKPNKAAETMPVDLDVEDAGEEVVEPDNIENVIYDMLQGLSVDEVADIFNAVFNKIQPQEEEPAPETLYSPGAEGRPQAGFKLQELKELIREVLAEGHYHDMGGEDEVYDVLDPYDVTAMSDAELIDMAHTDGIEEILVLDGEGGLVNREEVIAALKDV